MTHELLLAVTISSPVLITCVILDLLSLTWFIKTLTPRFPFAARLSRRRSDTLPNVFLSLLGSFLVDRRCNVSAYTSNHFKCAGPFLPFLCTTSCSRNSADRVKMALLDTPPRERICCCVEKSHRILQFYT
jgi:hypothetical protein